MKSTSVAIAGSSKTLNSQNGHGNQMRREVESGTATLKSRSRQNRMSQSAGNLIDPITHKVSKSPGKNLLNRIFGSRDNVNNNGNSGGVGENCSSPYVRKLRSRNVKK